MRYLITTNCNSPFFTEWFIAENNFNAEIGMVVYDVISRQYTTDGEVWKKIEVDHL